jgi:hypothetical protein
MQRLLIAWMYSIAACSVLTGCAQHQEVANQSIPATASPQVVSAPEGADERESFVFRAKYSRTRGPCIWLGDARAMLLVDSFTVVEVVKGNLTAENIEVRPLSDGGPEYPKELVEGLIYTLSLNPSEGTRHQLTENGKDGINFVWVDRGEIQEQKAGRQ